MAVTEQIGAGGSLPFKAEPTIILLQESDPLLLIQAQNRRATTVYIQFKALETRFFRISDPALNIVHARSLGSMLILF